jgi:glycosyltransferase involved in cell wall biosynthesis
MNEDYTMKGGDNLHAGAALASVVIPCYNQGHFLAEAIQTALGQDYANVEVVVVDDGSSDNTPEIAAQFEPVIYIRQENRGLSGARNAGLRASHGEYVLFIDADDRLTPQAVSAHLRCFAAHPEAGFVVGAIDHIDVNGSYLASPRWPLLRAKQNHYEELLRVNHVANTIAVMFKRSVFAWAGGFNPRYRVAQDYEMLLRAAYYFPSAHHATVVAQYRRYPGSISRNGVRMLAGTREVMRSRRPFFKNDRQLRKAYRQGCRYWRDYYGVVSARQFQQSLARGQILDAAGAAAGLLWYVRELIPMILWKRRRRLLRAASQRLSHWRRRNGDASFDAVKGA